MFKFYLSHLQLRLILSHTMGVCCYSREERPTLEKVRSICKSPNIDYNLFVRDCRMLNEYELNKLNISVIQVYSNKKSDVALVHINR